MSVPIMAQANLNRELRESPLPMRRCTVSITLIDPSLTTKLIYRHAGATPGGSVGTERCNASLGAGQEDANLRQRAL